MDQQNHSLTRRVSGPVHMQPDALTTIIHRLEAATSRLEDIASSSVGYETPNPNSSASSAVPLTPPMPTSGNTAPVPPKPVAVLPASLEAFDILLNTDLKAWLELSSKLGGVIDGQVRGRTI
jgi:adenylyl cyclase-associated protein